MEYEDVVEVEAEAQEELEIDFFELEDLENEFIIDKEESESDYSIADSCYKSNSNDHTEVTSRSITQAEINIF